MPEVGFARSPFTEPAATGSTGFDIRGRHARAVADYNTTIHELGRVQGLLPAGITFDIRPHLERKGINFIAKRCEKIDAKNNVLELEGGETLSYDFLVIATGPRSTSRSKSSLVSPVTRRPLPSVT